MLIQQDAADVNGKFLIALSKPMTVKLFVTYLGYNGYVSEEIKVTQELVVDDITLISSGITIEEVVVVGQRQSPSIKIEGGKLIYSPKNSTTLA